MRIPVRTSPRRILLLDTPEIYFLEGQRGLTGQGFVRIHRSYLVNLDRVREIRLRSGDPNDWEVKMDPPVNAVLPVGRSYLLKMKQQLGF
jgi:DNA-binding LytR/AlgR family response regulator